VGTDELATALIIIARADDRLLVLLADHVPVCSGEEEGHVIWLAS